MLTQMVETGEIHVVKENWGYSLPFTCTSYVERQGAKPEGKEVRGLVSDDRNAVTGSGRKRLQ